MFGSSFFPSNLRHFFSVFYCFVNIVIHGNVLTQSTRILLTKCHAFAIERVWHSSFSCLDGVHITTICSIGNTSRFFNHLLPDSVAICIFRMQFLIVHIHCLCQPECQYSYSFYLFSDIEFSITFWCNSNDFFSDSNEQMQEKCWN